MASEFIKDMIEKETTQYRLDPDSMSQSRIFVQYRSLGVVSNSVPCKIRHIHTRKQNLIVTSAGKAFNTYGGNALKLVSRSVVLDAEIHAIACDTYHVYISVGNKVLAWRRGIELKHTYLFDRPNKIIMPFGTHLVTLDVEGWLSVVDIKSAELSHRFHVTTPDFTHTCMIHPYTYENKVVIGSEEGIIRLWNISSVHMIYQFKPMEAGIVTMCQSTAIGIVAVALNAPVVLLLNINSDEIVKRIPTIDFPCSLAFRTDDTDCILIGGTSGSLCCWDLSRNLALCYETIHNEPVMGLECFPGEPICVTSSNDNSIKLVIFDRPDGGMRILNQREGHPVAPISAKFHGDGRNYLLSLGKDGSMRSTHIYNETYNRVLYHGITGSDCQVDAFVNCRGIHKPLAEDIVAYKKDGGFAFTLTFDKSKRGESILMPHHQLRITSAYITVDTQWLLLGLSGGDIKRYNMTSKKLHKEYANHTHRRFATVGIFVCQTGTHMISINKEGDLKYWKFMSGEWLRTLKVASGASFIFSKYSSNLFGVATTDSRILIFDATTALLVRSISTQMGTCISACFSPNMKWVVASFANKNLAVWDLPSKCLIDFFEPKLGVALSADFSVTGEYLITTHEGDEHRGMQMWLNRGVYEYLSLTALAYDEDEVKIPKSTTKERVDFVSSLKINRNSWSWEDMLRIHSFKMRNRPRDTVKPMAPPFFLNNVGEYASGEGILPPCIVDFAILTGKPYDVERLTEFGKKLAKLDLKLEDFHSIDGEEVQTFGEKGLMLLRDLEPMTPAQLDYELRSLGPEAGGSMNLVEKLIVGLMFSMLTMQYLQISQTILGLTLKLYFQELLAHPNPRIRRVLMTAYQFLDRVRQDIVVEYDSVTALVDLCSSDLLL